MIDITHKSSTYREAEASAVIKFSLADTAEAIKRGTVPKGNVLEAARTAGLLGIKQTPNIIPDCHVIPIEQASVRYELAEMELRIRMKVATIYKTGVEVEAMHGVSVVALTVYDMLKPIDKGIEIRDIKLESKKGGKSDFRDDYMEPIRAAIVVCSDTIAAGQKEDKAGRTIEEKLRSYGLEEISYHIIPDEAEEIREKLNELTAGGTDLILYTGGTGLSSRDVTPETLAPLLEREIPGMAETIRRYGQERMPYSMLSRSIAGVKGKSLVLALPGSTAGAGESMDAIFPPALHIFRIMSGKRHN